MTEDKKLTHDQEIKKKNQQIGINKYINNKTNNLKNNEYMNEYVNNQNLSQVQIILQVIVKSNKIFSATSC